MQKILRFIILGFLITFSVVAVAKQSSFTDRADVRAFIDNMVQKHQFDEKELTALLDKVTIQPDIIKSISKPAESLPWHRYRTIFMTSKRINDGVEFWQQNQKTLEKAQKEFGVPPEYIVAILGVETLYGKFKGKYLVLDSLATLGFDYEPRSKFFLSELEQYLLLTREQKLDPLALKGSYAGAMGAPQFISSSYRHYAVDYTGTGSSDLLNNIDDAIGSVANYFKEHGWKANEPVVFPALVKGDAYKNIQTSNSNPKPALTLTQLSSYGVNLNSQHRLPKKLHNENMAFIPLEGEKGDEYFIGMNNFYVITRYNHSSLYAMAVHDLAQGIKAARESNLAQNKA